VFNASQKRTVRDLFCSESGGKKADSKGVHSFADGSTLAFCMPLTSIKVRKKDAQKT
jgi:hypothetical protein